MVGQQAVDEDGRNWRLEDIDFSPLQAARLHDDETLFFMLSGASFVEIAADLYTHNLIDYFSGDAEMERWLRTAWQHEEVQHGRALKAYVQAVWPEFDWERAYAGFYDEYAKLCDTAHLEPIKALELAARCVVETGTSTLYRTLYEYIDEPVLKRLLGLIKADEVRHYKYFLRFYRIYAPRAGISQWSVLKVLLQRVAEAKNDDAMIAFKHAFQVQFPDRVYREQDFRAYVRGVNRIAKRHYPFEMSVQMLLKPMALGLRLRRLLQNVLLVSARRLLFR